MNNKLALFFNILIAILICAFAYKAGWNSAIKNAKIINVTDTIVTIEYTPSNIHDYYYNSVIIQY